MLEDKESGTSRSLLDFHQSALRWRISIGKSLCERNQWKRVFERGFGISTNEEIRWLPTSDPLTPYFEISMEKWVWANSVAWQDTAVAWLTQAYQRIPFWAREGDRNSLWADFEDKQLKNQRCLTKSAGWCHLKVASYFVSKCPRRAIPIQN